MAGFRIEPDQVKQVATDVSTMATSYGEMQAYTAQSQLAKSHFGKLPGLSGQAGAYVEKMQALGDSVAKAGTFLHDYATRLNQAATLHTEREEETAWDVAQTGKGA